MTRCKPTRRRRKVEYRDPTVEDAGIGLMIAIAVTIVLIIITHTLLGW